MCRLFGLSAAPHRVRASFWLLDAPDSLAQQSHREPDGTGLGTFAEDGTPLVEKQPLAAYEDAEFAQEAKHRYSATFVAHIRFATTGELLPQNTHPFAQAGRVFAHNGVVEDLPKLEAELGTDLSLVRGDTDSERVFALVTREIGRNGGDVTAGITAAARWLADNVPIYALNILLTTPGELWALRYRTPTISSSWSGAPVVRAVAATSSTRVPPAGSAPGPSISSTIRRWWSPASRWTKIRAGHRCNRANCCTSTATSALLAS